MFYTHPIPSSRESLESFLAARFRISLRDVTLENNSSVYQLYNSLVSHVKSLDHFEHLEKEMYGVILEPFILSGLSICLLSNTHMIVL